MVRLGWADRNLVNGLSRETLRQILGLKYEMEGEG